MTDGGVITPDDLLDALYQSDLLNTVTLQTGKTCIEDWFDVPKAAGILSTIALERARAVLSIKERSLWDGSPVKPQLGNASEESRS